ncbi:MAG: hypothetical protein DHS20C03_09180 [Minwuia thermotolerans]|nr:MAG: hypothetical protein DHS20C03_09180 [Minwuia thermotolerans]
MAQSVKLSDDVMALVRKESELQSRSVAGQITHWVRIGRAIEKSGNFDHQRISAALEASLAPEELTPEEHEVWLNAFGDQMAEPSEQSKEFFARRRKLGLGVGLSETGEIIRESDGS